MAADLVLGARRVDSNAESASLIAGGIRQVSQVCPN